MKKILTVAAIIFGISIHLFAHEGHDEAPGAVLAPHGGTIQKTEQLYWELLHEGGVIKLFPLTHELVPVAVKEISLSGTVQFPKKAKKEALKFKVIEEHYFETKVSTKKVHRFTLELVSTYKNKKEKVKFQVEPQ